jgi:hypothetical protein
MQTIGKSFVILLAAIEKYFTDQKRLPLLFSKVKVIIGLIVKSMQGKIRVPVQEGNGASFISPILLSE